MGGDVGGIEPCGVGCLLGPYLPKHGEVGKDWEVNGSSVLDGHTNLGEACDRCDMWNETISIKNSIERQMLRIYISECKGDD